jgi:1-acyl-sn-glycerol-3-phosphate acyltransferase
MTMGAAWIHGCIVWPRTQAERGAWRGVWAGRVLRSLGIVIVVEGTPPVSGLVVANHMSYVDVLTLGSVLPAIFVSKAEVRGWPLVGPLITRGGTLFLERGRARAAAEINRAVGQTLAEDVPVVIFPEGTTTAGDRVLPFHSALFESAVRQGAEVWPASVSYSFSSGESAARIVAYIDDDTLMPHLCRLAGKRNLVAHVRFAAVPVIAADRAAAAQAARTEVLSLLGFHGGCGDLRSSVTQQQTTTP